MVEGRPHDVPGPSPSPQSSTRLFEPLTLCSVASREQVYPASFKDDNGDGTGDLRGLINKLPYLKSLGIDTIWLSPHHKSPRIDEGYDISDYQDIHEPFGNMDDCQELIDKTHAHGLKILFDLVVNHCSDQHPWFLESRSSKTNPKADWFHWRPAKYDENGGEFLHLPRDPDSC